MSSSLSFIHHYEPAIEAGRPPLLLLHGTGGDETDLLTLANAIAPGAACLAPRGKVLENGMPRFFRRVAEGVFDFEDIRLRTDELAAFVAAAREAYDLPAPVAVGFSNGANIAAAMLLLRPESLSGAVLLRAMAPVEEQTSADLTGKRVLLLSGATDPLVPAEAAASLAVMLQAAKATVRHEIVPFGHGLSRNDLTISKAWFDEASASVQP